MLRISYSPQVRSLASIRLAVVLLLVLVSACSMSAQNGRWLTGYYATYNYSVMTTSQVDYTKLTHAIYWPVIPNTNGTLNTTPFGLSALTFSNGATDLVTRAHAAGVKALIGVGGNEESGATAGFESAAAPAHQATFISNIVTLMQQYDFDGVDIDWEGFASNGSDDANFVSFIGNLRTKLNSTASNLLLTIAPVTKGNGGRPDLIFDVYRDFDQINLQTYVMSGPYCGWVTWFNSPLSNEGLTFPSGGALPSIPTALNDYTSLGIPISRMAMGIQFDSAVWTGGSGTSNGGVTKPDQSWTYGNDNCATADPGAPSWTTVPYRTMITTLATTAGYTTNFDSVADQSWLSYDPSGTGTTNEAKDSFVSFDSPTSITKKGVDLSPTEAGVGGSLGGVFIFELSGDFAPSAAASQQHPLLNAAHGMKILLPGLITDLVPSLSGTTAKLAWMADPGSASYNVYSETAKGAGPSALVASVTSNSATIPNLTRGHEYWYLVEGVNSFGKGVATETSVSVPVLITPTITWATPAPITYGTALTSTQLDATASVPGTFVYTPAAGTYPPGGKDTLSVAFTPTASTEYTTATKTVSLTVNPATPTITWATPSSIPYGTPLSATQLDATANAAGSFVYTPPLGSTLPVGTDTLKVNFTPTLTNDWKTASATVSLVVTAATLSTSDSFGSENLNTIGTAHAITFKFASATTLNFTTPVKVLTMGVTGLDFENSGGGSCKGMPYPAGSSCTVNVTFAPTAAGERLGAAVLLGTNGDPLATAYISGTGTGPQIAYDPGTASAVSFAFQTSPNGIAVDGAGNMYYADYLNKEIWKVTPANSYSKFVSGLSNTPWALAIDGAGNLYVSAGSSILKFNQAAVQSTVGSGWYAVPKGIAVDGSGNVYVANTLANTVVKVTSGGSQSTVLSGTVLGASLSSPTGLAIDGAGNLYVADSGNNRILKVSAGGATSVALASGVVSSLWGMAIGGTGSLYITDPAKNRILELNPAGVQSTLLSGTVAGYAFTSNFIAADGGGNLYLSDFTRQRLLKINRSSPPSLSFASTKVGEISSDSPKDVTVENIGNANLVFPGPPAPGSLPRISSNFSLGSLSTCPIVHWKETAKLLAGGTNCFYSVSFEPDTAGTITGSLVMTDNNLRGASPKQTIALSGTGLADTAATVTLGELNATYTGAPIAATATTVPAGLTVSFTYDGTATAPTKAGSYTVVATVTTPGYIGSATGTMVIAKATPVITWATPAPITYGTVLSATQLDATANVTGSWVYTPAAGSTPPVGTDTLSVLFTPTDTTDYNTATDKVSLVVNAATAPARVVWIPDFYGDLLQVRVGTGASITAITVPLPDCNPNSVAIDSDQLYVVCSYDKWQNTNPDKILIYNSTATNSIRTAAAGTLNISPTQTISNAQFSSLVGIAFDSSNNLWVTSNGNNQVEMISAAALKTASPTVAVELISSPNAPAGLAFAADGSLWLTGLDGGGQGILLNFAPSQFGLGEGANPSYCMASESGQGCQYQSGLFMNDPEGVALVNDDVWVADNSTGASGTTPGRELIDVKVTPGGTPAAMGTLTVNAIFGNSAVAADSPFVCPGGLYSTSTHLWVSDESYGETDPQCGANGDVASKTGGVFSFTPTQLTDKTTSIGSVLVFSNVTGRPGFGGIFVENDQ